MTSQAHAEQPLPGVLGLVFVGFPLHPAWRPGSERGDHLDRVGCPLLFVQGTRDELAEPVLVRALVDRLGARATLAWIDDADHAFHVRRSSGSDDAQALDRIADTVRDWMLRHLARPNR
jgi:predicted alpha/beta-hydrolase family hydrolase